MRTFGLLLLIGGIAGFVYCSNQLGQVEPLPAGQALTIWEAMRYPAGKLEAAKDTAAALALFGLIFIIFWKDR
jgi:hypothetical protein